MRGVRDVGDRRRAVALDRSQSQRLAPGVLRERHDLRAIACAEPDLQHLPVALVAAAAHDPAILRVVGIEEPVLQPQPPAVADGVAVDACRRAPGARRRGAAQEGVDGDGRAGLARVEHEHGRVAAQQLGVGGGAGGRRDERAARAARARGGRAAGVSRGCGRYGAPRCPARGLPPCFSSPRWSSSAAAARCAPTIRRSPRCWRRRASRRRTSASPRPRRRTRRVCPATDPTQLAAAVARAVFPDPARKPSAITIVDTSDWRVAVAASALMAAPFKAPILFSDGTNLPGPSQAALDKLRPEGAKAAGNAQIIRVGNVARPAGYKTTDLPAGNAFALTRAIAGLIRSARPRRRVEDHHRQRRRPVLRDAGRRLRRQDRRPDPVRRRRTRSRPRRAPRWPRSRAWRSRGSSSSARPSSSRRRSPSQLKRFGSVKRTGGQDPVTNAIEFARYRSGEFGWGVANPGHGMVFTRTGPAALRGGGGAAVGLGQLRAAVPARRRRCACRSRCRASCSTRSPRTAPIPSPGVYNHGWIIGDTDSISVSVAGAHRRAAGDRPRAASG